MTTYSRREVVTRSVEYGVEVSWESGVDIGTVMKVVSIAYAEFKRLNGHTDDRPMYDNDLRLKPGDDEILIRFEVEDLTARKREEAPDAA